jgi:hypothetical protein
MSSLKPLLPIVLFFVLALLAALQGLSASGHFPLPRLSKSSSGPAPIVLFGTIALTLAAFAAGTAATLYLVPWYAAVIGGGLAVLAAPPILQLFPDRFVDNRGALLGFAGADVVPAILLITLAIG